MKEKLLCGALTCAVAVLTSSAVASANPATPMQTIESSAAQLCGAINSSPTEDGVVAGIRSLETGALDEIDGALVLITAVHHVCPQHEALIMGVLYAGATEAICDQRW